MKTVMIFANSDVGLYHFRSELIKKLCENNRVVCSVPNEHGDVALLEKIGGEYVVTDINRHSTNPLNDIKLTKKYISLIKKYKPDVVLSYTIKPNVYGGIACRITKTPYIANITGLGSAITHGGLLCRISLALYKIGLKKASCVFFQNEGNMEFMTSKKVIRGHKRLIPGSGVNLSAHGVEDYPDESTGLRFLYVGRIMKDKGVDELFTAFDNIHKKYPFVSVDILGDMDGDYEAALQNATKEGYIRYHGLKEDIHRFFKDSHCTVLPSYHEGLANALLESASTGRPNITTDIPGCRETVDDGVTGFLCKVRDADSLAEKIEEFILLDHEKKKEMGLMGRKKVEKEFDRGIVVDAYLEEIERIK